MRRVIFYSWQSDLPNPCNRGFIQKGLEDVAASITADDTIAVEPVVDRDTQGIPGAPDIASTIFAKIAVTDVFVADISITSRPRGGRSSPNPNVLIELGYAIKAVGTERVILVFNRAFGKIEELPFDLRMRRLVVYDMAEKAEDRTSERKKLESQLNTAIRTALEHAPIANEEGSLSSVIKAIENVQPSRVVIIRRALGEIFKKIESFQPRKHSEGGTVADLTSAINSTQEVVAEFSKIAENIAVMNDTICALEAYHWFGQIFKNYNLPEGYSGRFSNADFDYFKFIGHELFVTLVAFLLREQRWDILDRILKEPIPMKYVHHEYGPGSVYWEYASEHLSSLLDESPKKQRVSIHADILHDRHTSGGLSAILPFDEFAGADFFLFLYGELQSENAPDSFMEWRPWSYIYLKHIPMFIRNAEQSSMASHLIKIFKVPSIAEFKIRLKERVPRLRKLFRNHIGMPIVNDKDIERIGSR